MATREDWVKLIADFDQSGLSHRDFATQREVSLHSLRSWIYRLRAEKTPEVKIARVRIRDRGKSKVPIASPEATLEIMLGAAVVRVVTGTSVEYVAALVRALREGC